MLGEGRGGPCEILVFSYFRDLLFISAALFYSLDPSEYMGADPDPFALVCSSECLIELIVLNASEFPSR